MSTLLETLASYVPAQVVHHLARDRQPHLAPTADRFPAVVFFADISGFTALTEQFARRGPSGAEDLTRLLNAYFGQLIELVIAHGGDIVRFAGDGLLAIWPVASEAEDTDTLTIWSTGTYTALETQQVAPLTLTQTALCAAQCGLAVQPTLRDVAEAEGVRLSLKISIGAGEIVAGHLGGVYSRWEFLVAGDPLVQMSLAEKAARPGQVVLSPEAWTLVRPVCDGHRLSERAVCLDTIHEPLPLPPVDPLRLTPAMDPTLRAYIPAAILARLSAGQTSWLAELRRVTVIFIHLPDVRDTNLLEQGQEVMCALQTALYRYEGSVTRLGVDDKGPILIAALGLPPLAHEDDPVRGVRAALEMQAALQEMGMRSAIGVTTGQVFCGAVGSERRREYTMMGRVVNMAARLMQAAQDDLFCDAATYHAARLRVWFEALPPIKVKGRTEPVAVYRPLGQAIINARLETTLVGRATERRLMAEQLQALLRGGAGGVFLVEGDAGIGKTRLVEDLAQQAEAFGIPTLAGAGNAIEQSTPYYAWRTIFSQILGLDTLSDPTARRRRVEGLLAHSPDLLARVALLNALLPLDFPENEVTARMSGQVRADNTRTLLLELLQAVTDPSPRLLILEDAHWMDSASWALALAVSQHVCPLLLVIVARPFPEAVPASYRQLRESAGTQQLHLEGLSAHETMMLVCQRLNVTTLPDPVATLIREKTQGNPFFSEELAYALRDTGLIRVADGGCHLATTVEELRAVNLPDTVQGIITSRIDRLTPPQQLTLKVASVIGRTFSLRILRDVYPIAGDRGALGEHLARLHHLDLTPHQSRELEPTYIFKHTIIQDAVYNLMLFAQRRELHRAVARWYEQTYADDLTAFYPLLAHHWTRAEDTSRALNYLAMAGEQALRGGLYQEAVTFFSTALELDTRHPGSPADMRSAAIQRARWERSLGEAYFGLGQLTESGEHLRRSVALLGWPMPTKARHLTSSLLEQMLRQVLNRVWPPGRRVGRTPDEYLLVTEAAQAYRHLTQNLYFSNEPLPGIYTALRTLNLAESSHRSPELARAYANLSLITSAIPPLSDSYSRQALNIAERTGDLPSRAHVLLVKGMHAVGVGHWSQAQAVLEQAVVLHEQLGDWRGWGDTMTMLGFLAYFQGQFTQGVHLFAMQSTSKHVSWNKEHHSWGVNGTAMNGLRLGQVAEAVTLLETGQALLATNTDRVTEALIYGVLAAARLRQGELELAEQAAAAAMQRTANQFSLSFAAFDGLAGAVEVYLALWEASRGRPPHMRSRFARHALQLCRAFQRYSWIFPIGRPRAWLCQGWYHWLAGQPAQAQQRWYRSLAAAEQLAMPYEEGLAHYALGRHSTGAARQHHLEQACRRFAQLDAAYDLAHAQNMLL
jgi:class 3 adenylate cyclase/tetratricopeptide (TPR) repeat protein